MTSGSQDDSAPGGSAIVGSIKDGLVSSFVKMRGGFVVQVSPAAGAASVRLHFGRRRIIALGAMLLTVFAGVLGFHIFRLRAESAALGRLAAERVDQQRRLEAMERQAAALARQNMDSQRSIERIERILGAQRKGAAPKAQPGAHASLSPKIEPAAALFSRLQSLTHAAAQTRAQTSQLARLAARVLNLRRLASMTRARMIAAIPSLNPVNGGINAAFGWRTDPFPEFHKGLDLAADYGTLVHAAAAGTVATAGWAGDYGIRVDINHGNGYHTWYCHLSRLVVSSGEHVSKGEAIAAVGSTGESTGPHLHYQVMHDGVAVDPQPFLNGVPANVMATLPANIGVQ